MPRTNCNVSLARTRSRTGSTTQSEGSKALSFPKSIFIWCTTLYFALFFQTTRGRSEKPSFRWHRSTSGSCCFRLAWWPCRDVLLHFFERYQSLFWQSTTHFRFCYFINATKITMTEVRQRFVFFFLTFRQFRSRVFAPELASVNTRRARIIYVRFFVRSNYAVWFGVLTSRKWFLSPGRAEAFSPYSRLQISQKDTRYVCVRPCKACQPGRRKVILLVNHAFAYSCVLVHVLF